MSTGTGSLTALQDCGVLQQKVPLAEFTTWRVGGPAQWLAEPTSTEQIPELLQWARERRLPFHMIGAGSNLLIADGGLPGLTLCLRRLQGSALNADTGRVRAAAGEPTWCCNQAPSWRTQCCTRCSRPVVSGSAQG